MAKAIQGFGAISGIMTNSSVLNIRVNIPPATVDRRIESIYCGYSPIASGDANKLAAGRLLVVPKKFENERLTISPLTDVLPNELSTPVFDFFIDAANPTQRIEFPGTGLFIPSNADYTVILCAPATDPTAFNYPAFANILGFINVNGWSGSLQDPFGPLR